jgi:hypothetical protein
MSEAALYRFLGMHLCFEESSCAPVEKLTPGDMKTLRDLASRIAEIASLPVQNERKKLWTRLNSLKPVKPLVWMDEVCWHEMDYMGELTMTTSTVYSRIIEASLRQTLYQWNHMQGDMIVDPVIYSPLAISNPGLGIKREMQTLSVDEQNDILSQHYLPVIKNPEDIEKLQYPVIRHDEQLTLETFNSYSEIFHGILKVEKRGAPGFWFAPWDQLVMLTGVQEAMTDLLMRPEYIHSLVKRLVDIGQSVLNQYEALNLLSLNNYNIRVGSGAYGYCEELPRPGYDPLKAGTKDLWGCATAQIFVGVSPEMHEEFALQYEKKWAERFGLFYYGCCEPLDKKIKILEKIPNLRKISMSPWADLSNAAEQINKRYVISLKPSPGILVGSNWSPDAARRYLREKLSEARGHNIEIVMKDISTVSYEPKRLWDWTRIACETALEFEP